MYPDSIAVVPNRGLTLIPINPSISAFAVHELEITNPQLTQKLYVHYACM